MREARNRHPVPLVLALLGALAVLAPLSAARADAGADAAALRFAGRVAAALEGSPSDWDRLWAPDARDSTRRMLDLRTAAMFDWTDVRVEVESARHGGPAGGSSGWIDVTLQVRGTATWNARAFGVAEAFWTLQLDEILETNEVVRREAWRLVPAGGGWLAREREPLAGAEVVRVDVRAGVYPAQDALLVECSYYLRALTEGVRTCRFLLDRRANIYRLVVDGQPATVVRGGELGAFGLEGFSSESESSFRFPRALAKGEEVLVRFRVRSPLVHMRGDGFVTSLPIHDGPFRERVWYPLLFPDRLPVSQEPAAGIESSLEVRFPHGALKPLDLASGANVVETDSLLEEDILRVETPQHYRDFDFFLLEPGVDLETVDWSEHDFSPFRLGGGLSFLPTLGAEPEDPGDAGPAVLDPHPRSRRAIVEPLLRASTSSQRDLTSELDELLPIDVDQLDELFDDSAADADQGAGEPARD